MTTEVAGAQRANPFNMEDEDDPIAAAALLNKATHTDASAIRSIAEQRGFPSRESPSSVLASDKSPVSAPRARRVHRTGRNRQLTIKVSEEAFNQFYGLADKQGVVLGEAFQQALDAWAEKLGSDPTL